MSNMFPKFKAAAVQAAPVYLDLDKTVEKACKLIDEAGSNGAKLIAFPEAFIPGYPWWVWLGDPFVYGSKFYDKLYKNSVTIPSKAVQSLSEAAKRNESYVSVSVTERDGGSLYLTQLWFNPAGDLIGKHRKLKPTNAEKIIWGEGDGSMMPVFDTEIGRLGGLQCFEHWVPLNLTAMNSLNEQVHVAAWPSFLSPPEALFSTGPCETSSRYYSLVNQTFTLMCSQYYTQEMQDMLAETDLQRATIDLGNGCTKIFAPNGQVISNEVPHNEDGIAYADIDLEMIISGKFILDPAGHYSNSSLSLNFDKTPKSPVKHIGGESNKVITYNEIQFENK